MSAMPPIAIAVDASQRTGAMTVREQMQHESVQRPDLLDHLVSAGE